ncbi:universal stress protein [Massilia jejuensis]|uniref:Universal stress protein n=1 Tax=Massilia jejuensis TaxID=648894 RepID=A0ABW0PLK1_9BURK
MDYKTILVHADLSRHADARVDLAARLAVEHGAHLIGAAMTGLSRFVVSAGRPFAPGSIEAGCFAPLDTLATRALRQFAQVAARHGLTAEKRLVRDQADEALARLARFADLVVMSQDDPDEALGEQPTRLPESVILAQARPVLVVPRAGCRGPRFDKVLLAWDGGKEAAFAIAASLPLLRHAAAVTIAAFHPDEAAEAERPPDIPDLERYLLRHGVRSEVTLRRPAPDPGAALLALAAELGTDLLVMGCYGHSRFHELILGGASKTVLADTTLPVLMAH